MTVPCASSITRLAGHVLTKITRALRGEAPLTRITSKPLLLQALKEDRLIVVCAGLARIRPGIVPVAAHCKGLLPLGELVGLHQLLLLIL